jgi:hypothetical protein
MWVRVSHVDYVSITVTPPYLDVAAAPPGSGTAVFTVQAAGQTRRHSQSVTVYAARRVSVTAPALPYGVRGTARIAVQDARVLNQWQAAAIRRTRHPAMPYGRHGHVGDGRIGVHRGRRGRVGPFTS